MGSAFGLGFSQGTGAAQNNAQRKETLDLLQRQFLAKQYEQYANNIPLPDAGSDPEGYKKALDLRTKALESAQKVYAPDHHATLGDHLHGLIFGQKQAPPPQAAPVPVSAGAPVAPTSTAPPPPQAQTQPQPAPEHPFASNPAYSKILDGLKGLGNHLKAAVNPDPQPPPTTSLADFAGVPNPEDNRRADIAATAANAQKLEKMKADSAAEVARIRANGSGASTPEKAFLNAWAKKNGADTYGDLEPDDQVKAVEEWKKANAAPVRLSQAALATYLRAKYGDNPTAEQIAEGTREHQAMMSGVTIGTHQQLVFDDQGKPHVVTLNSRSGKDFGAPAPSTAPKSVKAPDLAAVNGQIANGNATSKKLNKGKPTTPKSSQAPQPPGLGFTKGDPLVKSDAAQYTKVAEDANTKKQAYDSAQRALAAGSTASSDQELIYSWVRANVQGAGRMTQAEFKQAASVGSLPQRAQAAWEKLKSGKLPPTIEQMLMADIKRSYEVSSAEAADLRSRLNGGTSPAKQPASATPSKVRIWNPAKGDFD